MSFCFVVVMESSDSHPGEEEIHQTKKSEQKTQTCLCVGVCQLYHSQEQVHTKHTQKVEQRRKKKRKGVSVLVKLGS